MKIGLIESRHEMPVEKYLLPDDATDRWGYGEQLANEAYAAARRLYYENGMSQEIDLYLTSLTVAAVGATAGLRSVGVMHFYSFDPEEWTYDRVLIFS